MKNIVFLGDVVENNGKTLKENNLTISHNIPLESLVEVTDENGEPGLRLYVVAHLRDCDGTPLYGLATNPKLRKEPVYKRVDNSSDELLKWAFSIHRKMSIDGGYSEKMLTIIKRGKE